LFIDIAALAGRLKVACSPEATGAILLRNIIAKFLVNIFRI
jgi:hypothetical protein